MKKLIFLAIAVLMASPTLAFGQDIFAGFGDALAGQTVSTQVVSGSTMTSGTGFIYVADGFEFDGFQVDLVSTDTGVAQITSATVVNSNSLNGLRFNNPVIDLNGSGTLDNGETGDINSIDAISIINGVVTLEATSVNQNGIVSGIFAPFDTGFDENAGLFQLAIFDFDIVGVGTTEFQLQTTDSDTFAGPTGFLRIPEGESLSPTFGSAELSVVGVPEPSTLGLLAFGLVGFAARRRR